MGYCQAKVGLTELEQISLTLRKVENIAAAR